MRVRGIKLGYFIYCLLVILPIYQDSPLSAILKSAGQSMMPLISLVAITIYILIYRKVFVTKEIKTLFYLGIWLISISAISIFIWGIFGNPLTLYGEWLPTKAFKVIIQYLALPAYASLILMFMKKLDVDHVFRPIVFTLVILTIIALIEINSMPYAFEALHFVGKIPYYRVRLLTTESSWTTLMIYNYVILSLLYGLLREKKNVCILALACGVLFAVTTGAKSLMVAIIVSYILYIAISFKKLSRRLVVVSIIAFIFGIFIVLRILPELKISIANDIKNYTSIATRSYTMVIGLLLGIIFPFGVGCSVYLGVFPQYLLKYIGFFNNLPFNLNTSEIYSYIYGVTDYGLTVKSGLLQYNMYWGIVGTFVIFKMFINISKNLAKRNLRYGNVLLMGFWCNVILISISSYFSFEFILMMGIVIYFGQEWNFSKISIEI